MQLSFRNYSDDSSMILKTSWFYTDFLYTDIHWFSIFWVVLSAVFLIFQWFVKNIIMLIQGWRCCRVRTRQDGPIRWRNEVIKFDQTTPIGEERNRERRAELASRRDTLTFSNPTLAGNPSCTELSPKIFVFLFLTFSLRLWTCVSRVAGNQRDRVFCVL
jgi:hypothetical protein